MEVTTYHNIATERRVRTINIGRSDESVTEYMSVRSVTNGFTKPNATRKNQKVDGYRKPSSYSCPAVSKLPTSGIFGVRANLPFQELFSATRRDKYSYEGATHLVCTSNHIPFVDHDVNALRTKVRNNVGSEVLDVAMVLAEVSGTAQTLTGNLLRLARSMDAVKRRKPENFWFLLTGKRRDGRRPTDKFLRESAGAYLEWKYGIMPTVMDISGACKGLDIAENGSLFDNPPLLVGRAVEHRVQRAAVPSKMVLSGVTPRPRSELNVVVTDTLKARLDYRVSGEGLRGLNRFGIGLQSVATVAFDKTPFSFVLNMAVPIADIIKAWGALAGVDVVGYCETRYRRVDVLKSTVLVDHNTYDRTPLRVEVPALAGAYVDWKRTAFSEVPYPLPYVRNPVKVGNLATVLSLFTQLRSPTGYK